MSPNSCINQKSSTLKGDIKETTPKENAYLTITQAPAASLQSITEPSSSTRYWNLIGISNQQRNVDHAAENSSTLSSNATNAHEISSSSSSSKIDGIPLEISGKKESRLDDGFCKLSKKLEEEEKDFW